MKTQTLASFIKTFSVWFNQLIVLFFIVGFSFSEIQFQNSSDKFLFSEDSNSQSSDTIPAKKFKSNDWNQSYM